MMWSNQYLQYPNFPRMSLKSKKILKRSLRQEKPFSQTLWKSVPKTFITWLNFWKFDLEIWVSAFLTAGTKEEQKHAIYKQGIQFTKGCHSENELVKKDVITSVLRHLLHGGTFGDRNAEKMDDALRFFFFFFSSLFSFIFLSKMV